MSTNNNNSSKEVDDALHGLIKSYTAIVVLGVVVFGTIGTILSLVVLIARKPCSRFIQIWFVALSLTDISKLLVGGTESFTVNFLHYKWRDQSRFSCHITIFLLTTINFASAYLQVAIAVYRVITLRMPLQHLLRLRQKRLLSCSLGMIVLFCALAGSLHSWQHNIKLSNKTNGSECNLISGRNDTVISSLSIFVLRVVIPNLLMLVTGARIVYVLFQSIRQARRRFIGCHHWSKIKRRHHRATLVLICMTINYMVGTLPYDISTFALTIQSAYGDKSSIPWTFMDNYLEFANCFAYVSFGVNWMFYLLLGRQMRQQFLSLYFSSCTKRVKLQNVLRGGYIVVS